MVANLLENLPKSAQPAGLPLDHAACYEAMRAHDARFDGRFFCGVSSTHIYCRPICRVKLPKSENCTFFPSAAAAEAAGYRPCLRCRPEIAPGLSPTDAPARLARKAAREIEEDSLADRSLAELAGSLGISDRHLRRLFFDTYGVSPVQYLQTRRLLLAKALLTDTELPVTEVAMTAGFGSIRRFNDLFRSRYRLTPANFRKAGAAEEKGALNGAEPDAVTLFLGYRPPFAWDILLSFFASRAIPGVEVVRDGCYRRTVAIAKGETVYRGWISVSDVPRRNAVAVIVAATLLPVLPQVLARLRQLLDLDCNPEVVARSLATLARVSSSLPVAGIRLPGAFDPFESVVRAVLGQQVTVKAARTLATRIVGTFGNPVATPFPELTGTFPSPEAITSLEGTIEDRFGPLGIIGSRARSILALARGMVSGDLVLKPAADPGAEMKKLLGIPGFGAWTVQYVAMRVLGWPDAFPAADYGVKKALSALPPAEVSELVQGWSPWRSYATVSLWHALALAEPAGAKEMKK
ncbi:AlkA N-terminal domain-containing protein [Geomesophilobacter sediminis]|uniref:DNA-3-methyladenine glycosylase II n=1 Tax=Geomesophilobacter sediminis TaxID=2798584 RepID=A0A8J7S9C0_9BACT|nr:AlkA N-terminal domain-containing protein [Geomesophilobacter sediminis]MBJ6726846.1 helix-turn-helix domain-containing protein [Geomesophilobacter sediminis]